MRPKPLNSSSWLTVKQMMSTDFRLIYLEDSLRTIVRYYLECKISTLPVVDEDERLIGVMPKKRLFKALLEGASLDDPCGPYIVYNPVFVSSELTYDEVSLAVRVSRSKVDYVVVVNPAGHVAGLIGTSEYLNGSIDVITRSSTLLDSLFNANFEAVFIVDNKGYILRINPAAEGMFSLQFSDIKGQHLGEVLPEINIMNKRLLGVKRIINGLPVIVNQMPIYDQENFMGTILTFFDISDLEQLAHELEIVKDLHTTLEGVLGSSDQGILVTDIFGRIKYVNRLASELLLKTEKNIIGKPIIEVLKNIESHQAMINGSPEITEAVINGRRCVISFIPIRESGSEGNAVTGMVSKIYINDSILTEQIAIKLLSLKQQVTYYRSELEKRDYEGSFEQIITQNPELKKIKSDAERIARSSSTVLLTGESGVGKDMFGRAIHSASPRNRFPFVKVNCAAIPETLFESELFGYAPGSFTGASKKGKPGYFEQADKGTIFLDEVGEMPLSIQVKILQVLQDKQFMRVGGTNLQTIDVRIIAATNKDLRKAISEGAFREDLFYRLNVIEFYLPPLRERAEDILPLADIFIGKYNQILGAAISGIDRQASDALENYSWPGNIRELENAIERAANYVWEGVIKTEHLPAQIFQSVPASAENTAYRNVLNEVDRDIILNTLAKTKGNKSAAARLLRISRSAFYDKLNKYGIN